MRKTRTKTSVAKAQTQATKSARKDLFFGTAAKDQNTQLTVPNKKYGNKDAKRE